MALHSLYNEASSDHVYTTDQARCDALVKAGWQYRGIAAYVFPRELPAGLSFASDLVPLVCLVSADGTDHMYSTNPAEIGDRPAGYTFEPAETGGVIAHVLTDSAAQTTAFYDQMVLLYGYYDSANQDHIYTTDEAEYRARIDAGAIDLGVIARVFPTSIDGQAGLVTGVFIGKAGVFFSMSSAEFNASWQQLVSELKLELDFDNVIDIEADARSWDAFEDAMLQGFVGHMQVLKRQVARLEFMFDQYGDSMDARFKASLKAWIDHFNQQMEDLVSATVKRIVDEQVTTKIELEGLKIRQQLAVEVNADIDVDIDAAIKVAIDEVKLDIKAAIDASLDARIDAHVKGALLDVRNRVVVDITNDIEQLVQDVIENEVGNIDIDMTAGWTVRLDELRNELARIRGELSVTIDAEDQRIVQWARTMFISLQQCLTDRDVFIRRLSAFVHGLRRSLNDAHCVAPDHWSDSAATP